MGFGLGTSCSCCGGQPCNSPICVRGCGEPIGGYSFAIYDTDEVPALLLASGPAVGPCTEWTLSAGGPGNRQVDITPEGIFAAYYDPITVNVEVICPGGTPIDIDLPLKDGYTCGDCQPCPGLPVPGEGDCFEIGDGLGNTIALTREGSAWVGCRTYSVPSYRYCSECVGDAQCYYWGTHSVPIMFTYAVGCGGGTFSIRFPATWKWDQTGCESVQANGGWAGLCNANYYVDFPSNGSSPCAGTPATTTNPIAVCPELWRLLGDLSCEHLKACAEADGDFTEPDCPADPEGLCDAPPFRVPFVVGLIQVDFEVDCEADDPYAAEITLDLGPLDGASCACEFNPLGGRGSTTLSTEDSPLAAIFGTAPTFTVSRC